MKRTDQEAGSGDGPAAASHIASFEIWPHRSLSARGTRIVLALTTLAGLASFLRSPATRAIPLVVGPLLAVAALAIAFRCNNRAAARAGETVEIGPDIVRVVRRNDKVGETYVEFSTGWVQLAVTHDRKVANRITLHQSGRTCSLGECLSPEERATLAKALAAALAEARRSTNVA